MHGHRSIIAARRAGLKPNPIFFEIDLGYPPPRFPFEDAEHALETGQHARVEMSLAEPWRLADLRLVVGCSVHVHTRSWSDALTELAEKIASNGAKQIIVACLDDGPMLQYKNGEWHAHA